MTYLSNIVRSEGDPKVLKSGPSSLGASDRLGRALGWFSIGLGFTELLAPKRITRALGMEGQESLVRAFGVRELGAGVMSLSTERRLGLWSRVGGDALDLAAVMTALRRNNPKRNNAGLALAMLAGVTLVDLVAAKAVTAKHSRKPNELRSYRDRSGFPKGLERARRVGRESATPGDIQALPEAWPTAESHPQAAGARMSSLGGVGGVPSSDVASG